MPDREKVIHAVETAFELWIDEYTGCSWFKEDEVRQAKEDALSMLKEQDAKEQISDAIHETAKQFRQTIVRCKDCVYWQDNNDGYPHIGCKWREDETPDPDDFCSAGERQEGR